MLIAVLKVLLVILVYVVAKVRVMMIEDLEKRKKLNLKLRIFITAFAFGTMLYMLQ